MPEAKRQQSPLSVAPGDPTRVTLAELIRLKGSVRGIRRPPGTRVQAAIKGGNNSKALGRGLDFSEVREYQPGDDVRNIDWKVTARSGRAHTKVFEEERERPFFIAIDLRSSMYFGTRVAYKSVVAARLAALIAWGAVANRDRVGGLVFSDRGISEIKPAAGTRGVTRLLNEVVRVQESFFSENSAPDELPFDDIFHHLRRSAHTGCSIVLLSDFNNFLATNKNAATRMIAHNHVVACRVFDILEKELPPPATYSITNGRQTGSISTASGKSRDSYQQAFAESCAQTKKIFSARSSHYVECVTSAALEPVAAGILNRLPGSL